jgi:CRISPR-associated protein Cas7/Csp1
MDKKLKGILVTSLTNFENHIANGDENKFANHTTYKKNGLNQAFVSGAMQRHVLANAIESNNECDENKKNTFVSNSNSDGGENAIKIDLRADMFGYLHLVEVHE